MGSYFEAVIKQAMKNFENVVPNSFTSLKVALYQTLNNLSIMQLGQLHKSLMLELYEDMGAGISYNPSSCDKPNR